MKKVLFISATRYDFNDNEGVSHLRTKFESLSKEMAVFVLARGKPWRKSIWGSEFYLFSNKFIFRLFAFCAAFWLCVFKKIDVIVAQSPLLEGFIGVFIKKILGKELIVEIHGDWLMRPTLVDNQGLRKVEEGIVPWLAKKSLESADKIRVISSFTKSQAQKIAPNKPYFTFPTFTDLSLFLEEKDVHLGGYILFVGRLEEIKGINFLIEAFSKITGKFPEFKLVIVGDGTERKNFELLAEKLWVSEKIIFKGKLSLKQTRDAMKNCYCLVLPSLTEGLGRVLLEAGALAKPLVGSRTGGIVDIISDNENGFLIEPSNAEELAKKLEILLADFDLALKMGQKSRQIIKQNFSNEKYLAEYQKMIYT